MLSRAAWRGRPTAEMLERHTFQADQKMGFYAGVGSMAPAPASLSKPIPWPWGQINQGGCPVIPRPWHWACLSVLHGAHPLSRPPFHEPEKQQ